MKMLVQVRGGWSRTQVEVRVQELHTHDGIVIATHHAPGRYDMWTASDLLSGMAITSSISKDLLLTKAKKIIDKHAKKYKGHQVHSLSELYKSGPNYDFKLLERIERKCVSRGFSSVKTIEITGEFADELYVKNEGNK